jgi:hypothetical protein
MKAIFTLALAASLCGCYTNREVEVQTINVQLIRIDTIYRHPGLEQVLTWQTDDNVKYVSYENMQKTFTLGSRFTVMIRR